MYKCIFCGILFSILLTACVPRTIETPEPADEVAAASAEELGRDIVKWNEAFPLQAADNEKNYIEQASPTGYNGSLPFQRWELTPEIKTNFSGIAFSKDYKEDRGHVYAWDDIFETDRTSDKTPGACITCKTSDIEVIFEELGWDYASMKMVDFTESGHAGIDCLTCHDETDYHLRVVQPAFIEAMEGRGVSLDAASDKEMWTYVCAQCHSEYYFEPGTTRVVFPWQKGLSPENMYLYYQEQPSGFTGDYTNPVSDTRLLKAQHPDYEVFQSGIHAAANLSCADCHMPRTENGVQHWITSPLHTIEDSCLSCHKGKTEDWMLERVEYIQDSVFNNLRRAGVAIEDTHYAINKAAADGVADKILDDSRAMLREAQWYWDFVASANSGGFHNSNLAHENLSRALDLAHKARLEILASYQL